MSCTRVADLGTPIKLIARTHYEISMLYYLRGQECRDVVRKKIFRFAEARYRRILERIKCVPHALSFVGGLKRFN